jgi:hypothetical protein
MKKLFVHLLVINVFCIICTELYGNLYLKFLQYYIVMPGIYNVKFTPLRMGILLRVLRRQCFLETRFKIGVTAFKRKTSSDHKIDCFHMFQQHL